MSALAHLTPVQIDTELARIYYEQSRIDTRIAAAVRHLDDYETALERQPSEQLRNRAFQQRDRLEALQAERRALIAESAPYQAEHARRGWKRYFLVDNAGGHVHRGMNCTTCFPTTSYTWLVELADCDEAAMVEEWGERACTVCFPDAPTNPAFRRPAKRDQAARDAAAAEKAAKAAAKAEKAIVDVDGSPLRVGGYLIRTKVAARNEMSAAIQSLVAYGTDHTQNFAGAVRQLAAALDAAGVDWVKPATNAIKRALREFKAPLPAHLAHFVTDEQRAENIAKAEANAKVAEALIEELCTR